MLRTVLENERVNAAIAWPILVVIAVAAVLTALRGSLLWAGLAATVVALALVPTVARRDPTVTLPWELLALAAAPLWVRLYGTLPIAGFLTVAAIALIVSVELDAYTEVEMSPAFAAAFVVVTTMAVTGVWVIAKWVSDALLATTFIGGKAELNWDMAGATAFGVLAGVLFALYFLESDDVPVPGGEGSGADRGERDGVASAVEPATAGRAGGAPGADRAPGDDAAVEEDDGVLGLSEERCWQLARAVQGLLVLLVAYAAVTLDGGLLVNALIPLGVAFVPDAVRRRFGGGIGGGLALWIAVAAFLHAFGSAGPYRWWGWYDQVAHTVSATLVAGVGYALVVALDQTDRHVSFPGEFRFVFVVIFVMAFGVLWELGEFGISGAATLFGSRSLLVQFGVNDIVFDLLFNTLGAIGVALWATGYFDGVRRIMTGEFRESEKVG